MILSHQKSLPELKTVGPKAYRLIELTGAGYTVPPFLIITGEEVSRARGNEPANIRNAISRLTPEIVRSLPYQEYAVRSSMSYEDTEHSSNAGQFTTILKVTADSLCESVATVIEDACTKLPRGILDCSVIVQQYIEPDYAGVIFTRNPLGGREVVLEYRKGSGDKVVGGHDTKSIHYLRTDASHHRTTLPTIEKLTELACAMESMYDFPQDIEWACRGGVTYLLQTRPITSITKAKWRGIVLAESELLPGEKFYFEKTVAYETFDRPTPLAFSILNALYREGGPIERAYANSGVRYSAAQNQFKLFGIYLFVDRQAETRALFPSLGYTKANTERIRIETWRGMVTTVGNMWHLFRLSLHKYTEHARSLHQLENTIIKEQSSVAENFKLLMDHYDSIFETNIYAQKSLTVLERHLGKRAQFLPELLMDRDEGGTPDLVPTHAVSLRGNSLNIDDITPFTARRTIATEHMATTGFEKWWSSLPHWKQIGFTPHIERARGYVKLREYARMLSVRLIDNLRTTIEDQATVLFPETKDLLFFATIEEIIGGEVVKSRCEERQREYKERLPLVMPQYVASFVKAPTNSHCVGVSPGIAEGVIVARENLNDNPQEKILYTERLTPDIVQYFSSIKGIVSQHGGILSHLAIMARESGIPVLVTNGSFSTPLGKRCRINGLTGEVTVLDS